jgi:hypothetical protein
MDTRFNIINDQQDFTEINFLLGDNQQRGSFKIGDFFKTSWLDGFFFKIETFGYNAEQVGLKVPTTIYFNRWKGGDDWDNASYFRDISPGEDFLKTMEKTAKPQSGGKRKRKSRGRKSRGRKSTRKHKKKNKKRRKTHRKRRTRKRQRKKEMERIKPIFL